MNDGKLLAESICLLAGEVRKLRRQMRESNNVTIVLKAMEKLEGKLMKELDDLSTEVEETNTAIDSAIKLIKGLSDLIKAAGTDATKLKALTTALDSKNKELSEAVVANTPAEPEPPTT